MGADIDAARRELERVLDQVGHHLREPVGVGCGAKPLAVAGDREGDAGVFGRRSEAFGRVHDQLADVDRARLEREAAGVEPGQREQIAHEPLEAPRLGGDHRGRLGVIGSGPVRDRLGEAADRGQGRAQVVRDRQEELALEAAGTVELGRHGVDGAGEDGELVVVVGHRDPCREVARRDAGRGGLRVAERARQPGGEAERDRNRRGQREQRGEDEPTASGAQSRVGAAGQDDCGQAGGAIHGRGGEHDPAVRAGQRLPGAQPGEVEVGK